MEQQTFNTEAGLGDVLHKIKKHFHQARANHHEDKAALHHARAHTYLAKRLSTQDMKHYIKGNYDKMSAKGQKRLNSRAYKKNMERANAHDEKATHHVGKAVDAHVHMHGIGKKKAEIMHYVAKRNSDYNKRVKSLNHMHTKLGETNNKRIHKNLKKFTNTMHTYANMYKDNARKASKIGNLKKSQRNIHQRIKPNYGTPKKPKSAPAHNNEDSGKVDSKPKPEANPSNPNHPKQDIEHPTDLDNGKKTDQ